MPLVAAHRGGADLAPENTLQAFRAAQGPAIEAELIELDLHRAADGELVVIHDRTVDRVTGAGSGCSTLQDTEHETFGSLAVADLTLAELQELDAGACHDDGSERFPFRGTGVQIPSLRQVLEELDSQRFLLEVKDHDPATAVALLDLLESLDAYHRTCILDFDDAFVTELAGLAPEEACIAMPSSGIRCWSTAEVFPFGGGGCPSWDVMWMPHTNSGLDLARPGLVRDLQAAGIPVFMWTANDRDTMEAILQTGANGVVTDRPDLLRSLLEGGSDSP